MIKFIFGFFIILGLGALGWLYNLYDEIKHDVDTVVNIIYAECCEEVLTRTVMCRDAHHPLRQEGG